jgi:phosphotransferase system  glucose/maltose/N-acetylglucosamine-specific IIC component
MSFKIIVSGISILVLIYLHLAAQAWASGSVDNNCPVFSIKEGCDLSSWIHLIMDVCIGAFLAVFFHHLAHKQNVKLKKIIDEHDAMKKRKESLQLNH